MNIPEKEEMKEELKDFVLIKCSLIKLYKTIRCRRKVGFKNSLEFKIF